MVVIVKLLRAHARVNEVYARKGIAIDEVVIENVVRTLVDEYAILPITINPVAEINAVIG